LSANAEAVSYRWSMRKWVRIAAALVLVALALSVPRSEIEIHKRKCQGAWNSLQGKSMTARLRRLYRKVTGTTPKFSQSREDRAKLSNSQEALIELGFLTRARFVIKNMPADFEKAFYTERPQDAFVRVEWHWNDNISIVAPRSEMLTMSNIVRKIDERIQQEMQ
jgi:hypothetical protein